MSALASADKPELRARLRRLRRDLARRTPDGGERAAARLDLARLPPFSVVSGYHPTGSELDCAPVLRRLAAAGATLALPVVGPGGASLVFRGWRLGEPLAADALRTPAPHASASALDPDLVIAPLLGFDRSGGRLGQGGGYFDRTIANLRAVKAVFVVGLAFSGQELDHVPVEAHDQRLDAVLTEAEFLLIGD